VIDPYTHQSQAIWPAATCTLAYRLKNGNTPYASLSGTTLTLASTQPTEVGTYSITVEAYYATYVDTVAPT